MAPIMQSHGNYEAAMIQQSLKSVSLELRYESSNAAIEILAREEECRRLQLQLSLLREDVEDLNQRVWEEEERADDAEFSQESMRTDLDDLHRQLEDSSIALRSKTREFDMLKVELSSLQGVSADSTKFLTEKLALAREVATFKAEIEDLRAQVSANRQYRSEKLSLQKEVNLLRDELEQKNRRLSLAKAKEGKATGKDSEVESQLEDLERQLAKGKRERQKLQDEAEVAQTELKSEISRLNRNLSQDGIVNERGLEEHDQLREVKKELAREKREREKAERLLNRAEADWEAQKAILDDKLNQFRTKLRANKVKLKDAETELHQAHCAVGAAEARGVNKALGGSKAKNPRKRGAAQMDPDAAIGTPGDAVPAKRGNRAASVLGGKSTFSITPFLNRTTSIAPESPAPALTTMPNDDVLPSIENDVSAIDSPTATRAKPTATKKTTAVLAPSSPGKSNPKALAASKAKLSMPALDVVEEEAAAAPARDGEENIPPLTKATAPLTLKPLKTTLKPKSLASFASFREGSVAPEQVKKKRRLLGASKTLFDEDEETGGGEVLGGSGGQRAFGAFSGKGFAMGLLGKKKAGLVRGPLVTAGDGFTFSPLKKDRKAAAAAAAAIAVS